MCHHELNLKGAGNHLIRKQWFVLQISVSWTYLGIWCTCTTCAFSFQSQTGL